MIVYSRIAVRRYAYGGSGIVGTVGSLLARYAGLDKQNFECVRQRTLNFNSAYAISRTAYAKYNQGVRLF